MASQSETASPGVVSAVILPALNVGCMTGVSGVLIGGVSGIIRSSTPVLFAAASGLQCFALGSTYWGARNAILHAWHIEHVTPDDRIKASTIAGGFAGGSIGLLTRGRANVLPGTIMFSVFGYFGQSIYNSLESNKATTISNESSQIERPNIWKRLAQSSWTPVKFISDEDYQKMLEEKLLSVEAEIALLDEEIENLRKAKEESSPKD